MAWQVEAHQDGYQIIAEDQQVVAVVPVNATQDKDAAFAQAQLLCNAPQMVTVLSGEDGELARKMRYLGDMLGKLTDGPISGPLDQMMRITNELLGWKVFLNEFAGDIDQALAQTK